MKAATFVKGLLRTRLLGRPFYSKVYVTRRCNLRCWFCKVWTYGEEERHREMGLEGFQRVAATLKRLGVPTVVLTGGEPFVRRDLPEIVHLFASRGFSTRLQTNASPIVTAQRLQEVIDAGLDDLSISLDSLDAERFDRICRSKGVWENVVNLLPYALRKMPRGLVAVGTTISDENIAEVPDLIRFVDRLGAFSIPMPVMLGEDQPVPGTTLARNAQRQIPLPVVAEAPSGACPKSDSMFRGDADGHGLTGIPAKQVDWLFGELIRMKRAGVKILVSYPYLRDMAQVMKTGDMRWRCDAGNAYFVVLPDGSISPCDDLPPIAHMLEEDFAAHYGTPAYQARAAQARRGCVAGCMHACWRDVSYIIHSNRVLLERGKTFLTTRLSPLPFLRQHHQSPPEAATPIPRPSPLAGPGAREE